MTVMNFTRLTGSSMTRVPHQGARAFNCFPVHPSPPPAPSPSPLTCQPSVPGVLPNDIQGPGRGVSDVVTKGPPERGPQGPRHRGGLRVPHPREGHQGSRPGGAATMLFRSAPAPAPAPAPPAAGGPGAAGGGCAGGRGPGAGTGRPRAPRLQQPGDAAGAAAPSAPTAGGLLDGGQAPAPARPHLERLTHSRPGCLVAGGDASFLCNPATRLGPCLAGCPSVQSRLSFPGNPQDLAFLQERQDRRKIKK